MVELLQEKKRKGIAVGCCSTGAGGEGSESCTFSLALLAEGGQGCRESLSEPGKLQL